MADFFDPFDPLNPPLPALPTAPGPMIAPPGALPPPPMDLLPPQPGFQPPPPMPGGMPMATGTPSTGLLGPQQAPVDPNAQAVEEMMADPTLMMAPGTNMPLSPDESRRLELGEALDESIQAQMQLLLEPEYPPWYDPKDYPKPDPATWYGKALELEQRYAELRRRMAADYRVLTMEVSGTLPDFDEKEDMPWKDSGIVAEVELLVNQLAESELTYDAPAKSMTYEDESAKKIDFITAFRQQEIADHGERGYEPLEIAEARTLATTGRLCWQILPDPECESDRIPFQAQLLDPGTAYPVFENRRGMSMMAVVYTSTLDEAIGEFETRDNGLRKKFLSGRDTNGKFRTKRNPQDQIQITDIWDRRWRCVFFDGEPVLGPVAHNFGYVPFIYKLSPLGLPGHVHRPEAMRERDMADFKYTTMWGSRDVAHPSKGISLIGLLRIPHQLHEAIQTKMLDALRTSFEPPLLIEMDQMVYKKGVPNISRKRKTVSPIRMNMHAVTEIPTNPNQAGLQSILQSAMENRSKLFAPATAHGENGQMTQLSGMALQGFNEAGRIKLVGWKKTLEQFQAEKSQMLLRMYRDWGPALKQGRRGAYGKVQVGRIGAAPAEPKVCTLTPEDIRITNSVSVICSYNNMPVSMLGPLANALSIIDGMGLLDPIEALKLMGFVNPYRHMERIKANRIINDPIVTEAQALHALYEQGFGWIADYIQRRKFTAASGPGQPIAPDGTPLVGPDRYLQEAGAAGPGSGAIGDAQAAFNRAPGSQGETPGRPTGMMPSTDPFAGAF